MTENKNTQLHIAMYPWLAMGHITPFLLMANKLAEKGHKISFFLPRKLHLTLTSQNNNPKLITFIPVDLPPVNGLPLGAETTNDIAPPAIPLLTAAMDLTEDTIEAHLMNLKPDFVFFDWNGWLPKLARKHGIKSIHYWTGLLTKLAFAFHLSYIIPIGQKLPEATLMSPLPSFPSQNIVLKAHEAQTLASTLNIDFGGGVTLFDRFGMSFKECDAFGVMSCREMEGVFCDFIENTYGKPVLTAGPVIPVDSLTTKLEDRFDKWLNGFESGEVVYCAFGSQCTLRVTPFQELVLGLELTGRPFLAAFKPPTGYTTIESALPEGFLERTKERGIVYGGLVQQQLILQHPSIGCFVTHCGAGSLSGAMVNKCQLVMLPNAVDQFLNARFMSLELKVGIEVDRRNEDGFYSREDVCKAVNAAMDEASEVGKEVRVNHAKWRDFSLSDGIEERYMTGFIQRLRNLIPQSEIV